MYSEGTPEFMVDPGLYYPAPAPINFGYYYPGFETPGEWDGHTHFFDGQDVQSMGGQIEGFPYQYYYSLGYEYSQPLYNPYDPYASGAVVGASVPHTYAPNPQYNDYIPQAPYYQTAVQPRPDMSMNPVPWNKVNGTSPNRVGSMQTLSSTSTPFTMIPASAIIKHTHSVPENPKESGTVQMQTNINDKENNGLVQVASPVSNASSQHYEMQLKQALPICGVLPNYRPGVYQPVVNPTLYEAGSNKSYTVHSNMPSDQTLVQQVKKLDHQLVVKSYTKKAGNANAEGNIIIHPDQYNKADFPVDYSNAKFFVIKSYSEDDVHKSIKYNVWSSTPNGNKKLDRACEDAQRVAEKDPHGCPVFLFFSVNASGNFCGVAEMTGRVDFHKDMDFWQQDKWSGSFPVKWHIIKDVPNVKFRHISLENNENNPVTYSRDTQEVMHKPGLEVLRIFKSHAARASLLDDFFFYETREKYMHEERAGQTSQRSVAPIFIPGLHQPPPRKLNYVVSVPAAKDVKVYNHYGLKSAKQVHLPADAEQVSTANENSTSNVIKTAEGESDKNSVGALKIGLLAISSEGKNLPESVPTPAPALTDPEPEAMFTVGTMPVKINTLKKTSASRTSCAKPKDTRGRKVG